MNRAQWLVIVIAGLGGIFLPVSGTVFLVTIIVLLDAFAQLEGGDSVGSSRYENIQAPKDGNSVEDAPGLGALPRHS